MEKKAHVAVLGQRQRNSQLAGVVRLPQPISAHASRVCHPLCPQFVAWAKAVCEHLKASGFSGFMDYIDPCSGLPVRLQATAAPAALPRSPQPLGTTFLP